MNKEGADSVMGADIPEGIIHLPEQVPGGFCRFLKRKSKWADTWGRISALARSAHPEIGGQGKQPVGKWLISAFEIFVSLLGTCEARAQRTARFLPSHLEP